jgi:prepilin-type N-terminal cleavage/methylation domain-containing protein
MIIKPQKAFTLAEVLITLLIIGVVASLVVPNIIADTQQAEFITAWKKAYGVIMQAQLNMIRENGSVSATFSNIDCTPTGVNIFMNTWIPYLSVVKTCMAGRIITDDCHTVNFKSLDGSVISNYNSIDADSGAVLSDGIFVNFYAGVCGGGSVCSDSNLFIDINGTKGPNIVGKDVFRMKYDITKGRFIPGIGATTCSGAGWSCGAYYLFH